MTLVLDAGALIAVERDDRAILARLKRERLAGRAPITHGGVVAQVWRGGAGRQSRLAAVLAGVKVAPLDDELGRRTGSLLGSSSRRDVVDAALVLLARDGDEIITSDVDDLASLAAAARLDIDVAPV